MADPDNARLLGLLAYWLVGDVLNGWNNAGTAEVDRAEATARRAISLDPNVPRAHAALGWVHRIHGDHQAALASFREAFKVDPNFAGGYAQAANELLLLGDAKAALPLVQQAIALSPKDESINVFEYILGRAYFALGDYAKAADALEESVKARPNLWFVRAWQVSALALSNRDAEAKLAFDDFKKAYSSRASYAAISQHYAQDRFKEPGAQATVTQMLAGLKKAGVQ